MARGAAARPRVWQVAGGWDVTPPTPAVGSVIARMDTLLNPPPSWGKEVSLVNPLSPQF
jgi:hypothetical protein